MFIAGCALGALGRGLQWRASFSYAGAVHQAESALGDCAVHGKTVFARPCRLRTEHFANTQVHCIFFLDHLLAFTCSLPRLSPCRFCAVFFCIMVCRNEYIQKLNPTTHTELDASFSWLPLYQEVKGMLRDFFHRWRALNKDALVGMFQFFEGAHLSHSQLLRAHFMVCLQLIS